MTWASEIVNTMVNNDFFIFSLGEKQEGRKKYLSNFYCIIKLFKW